jgi:hypothetical protein
MKSKLKSTNFKGLAPHPEKQMNYLMFRENINSSKIKNWIPKQIIPVMWWGGNTMHGVTVLQFIVYILRVLCYTREWNVNVKFYMDNLIKDNWDFHVIRWLKTHRTGHWLSRSRQVQMFIIKIYCFVSKFK